MRRCLTSFIPSFPNPGNASITVRTQMRKRTRMGRRARLAAVAVALAAALAAGLAPGLAFAATAGTASKPPEPPGVAGRSAILVDAASGAVLWGRDPGTPRAPASLTKMLTALVVRATLPLDAVAVAGKDAATAAPTRLGLRAGQRLRVGPGLEALMILSANDAAVLLADRAGGSPERFQAAMNAEAGLSGCARPLGTAPTGSTTRGTRRAPTTWRSSAARCCATPGSPGWCACGRPRSPARTGIPAASAPTRGSW
jgi:hypothetical protein